MGPKKAQIPIRKAWHKKINPSMERAGTGLLPGSHNSSNGVLNPLQLLVESQVRKRVKISFYGKLWGKNGLSLPIFSLFTFIWVIFVYSHIRASFSTFLREYLTPIILRNCYCCKINRGKTSLVFEYFVYMCIVWHF